MEPEPLPAKKPKPSRRSKEASTARPVEPELQGDSGDEFEPARTSTARPVEPEPLPAKKPKPPRLSKEAAHDKLVKMYSIVAAPPMPPEALELLGECAWLFGHHKNKDRGTCQSTLLDEMAEDNNALGKFLRDQRDWVGLRRELVNRFLNVNHGEVNKKAVKGENGLDHVDKFTKPATLRVLQYYMSPGQIGCLTVKFEGHDFPIDVPTGCALVCKAAMLQQCKHKHTARGPSLSMVSEVTGTLPVSASVEEQLEAGTKQEELPLPIHFLFTPWKPCSIVKLPMRH